MAPRRAERMFTGARESTHIIVRAHGMSDAADASGMAGVSPNERRHPFGQKSQSRGSDLPRGWVRIAAIGSREV